MRMLKTEVTYEAVHIRLKVNRGKAQDFRCVECGDQAQQWALQNPTANNRRECPRGRPYSLNIQDYEPMCVRCHRVHDFTVCRRAGHPLTPENTYVAPKTGHRACRECRREQSLAAYYRRKAVTA